MVFCGWQKQKHLQNVFVKAVHMTDDGFIMILWYGKWKSFKNYFAWLYWQQITRGV